VVIYGCVSIGGRCQGCTYFSEVVVLILAVSALWEHDGDDTDVAVLQTGYDGTLSFQVKELAYVHQVEN
jgi:hypothetical protein